METGTLDSVSGLLQCTRSRDSSDPNSPRLWPVGTTYTVGIAVCAPYNANAGLGPAVTVKAHLEGYPRVADSVILSTNVIHVFDLDAEAETTDFEANPGDIWLIPTTVTNAGNGPDRYDLRLGRFTKLKVKSMYSGILTSQGSSNRVDEGNFTSH